MAWLPIAYSVPQYVDSNGDPASGFVLKAYQVGTTTNIPFATTNEGTTTANSIALNANGNPEVSGNVVIPHLDQDYKLALYPSQSAADSDTGAVWTIDDIDLIQTSDTATTADINVWPLVDYGGAYFDGSNDYLTRGTGLTGASDGKKGTIVAFVTFDATASAAEYILQSTGDKFILRRDSSGNIDVIAENAAGTTILSLTTSSTYNETDTVYCIMASWDLATPGSGQLYINDTSDIVSSTFTNDTIDYTVADWAVGADVSGTNKMAGNVLSLWFDPTDNLDFDTETNRRKFLDESDNPVFLGHAGELVTGSSPILFLGDRDEKNFEINRGTGGNFTENGSIASSTVTYDGQRHEEFLDNYLSGLTLSNGTDSDHDIDIATGVCTDNGNTQFLRLSSALTKQIDANWASGTDAGGFASGLTLSNNTWYHVFLVDDSNGDIDAGFDTDDSATNLLSDTGGSKFRHIGWILTDGSSNITAFIQQGHDFFWDEPVQDEDNTNPGTAAVTPTLTVPPDEDVSAIYTGEAQAQDTSSTNPYYILFSSPRQSNFAATATRRTVKAHRANTGAGAIQISVASLVTPVNSSGQVRYRADNSDSALTVTINTMGWRDHKREA